MKISIIIPAYNCEKYIEKMIESILKQKYKDYEVIIINDGSTDSTKQILDKYNKITNFKIVNQKNGGVSSSRNKGISLANGELICFCDADDYIDENYFEEISNCFKEHPDIELLNFGYFYELGTKKKYVKNYNYKEKKYKSKKEIKLDLVDMWESRMMNYIWNKIYLTKIIKSKNILFSDYDYGEDIEFNRKYINNINCLYVSPKSFYHYRGEVQNSLTTKYRSDMFEIRKKFFNDMDNDFKSWGLKKSEYYTFLCSSFFGYTCLFIEKINLQDFTFKFKYNKIKKIICDPIMNKTVKYVCPSSKKIAIYKFLIQHKKILLLCIITNLISRFKKNFSNFIFKFKYKIEI